MLTNNVDVTDNLANGAYATISKGVKSSTQTNSTYPYEAILIIFYSDTV